MANLSDDLQQQLADAQKDLDAFKGGHDTYVQQFKATNTFGEDVPGWQAKAENEYNSGLRTRQQNLNTLRSQLRQAQKDEAGPQQAPAAAAASQASADKTNADAARQAQLDKERQANQAKGIGYVTNAEAAQLGLADKRAGISDQMAGIAQQRANDQVYIANMRNEVAQGRLDATAAAANVRAYLAEQNQALKTATDLATTQMNNETSQGNNRASNAASILDRTGSMALDVAKGGGTPDQIGGVLNGMLGIAPDFQQQMGGTSANFGVDHFKDLLSMIQSGQVQPDQNGSVVLPALQAVAAKSGALPGAGAQQPGWGPGNPDYDRQAAAAQAGGMEGSVNTPAFVAP